jgi:hypothetical protein
VLVSAPPLPGRSRAGAVGVSSAWRPRLRHCPRSGADVGQGRQARCGPGPGTTRGPSRGIRPGGRGARPTTPTNAAAPGGRRWHPRNRAIAPASDPSQHVGGPTVDRCAEAGLGPRPIRRRCARHPPAVLGLTRLEARPATGWEAPRSAGPCTGDISAQPTDSLNPQIRSTHGRGTGRARFAKDGLGGVAPGHTPSDSREGCGWQAGNRLTASLVDLDRRHLTGAQRQTRGPVEAEPPRRPARWTGAGPHAPSVGGAAKLCPWGLPGWPRSCIVLLRRPLSSAKSSMSRRTTSPPRGHRPPEETGRGRCDTV